MSPKPKPSQPEGHGAGANPAPGGRATVRIRRPGTGQQFQRIPWPPESPEHWALLSDYLIWVADKLDRACVCKHTGPGDDPGTGGGMDKP